ncbi:MAG: TfoX/Sxy family protein [Micrococcales bacterium]|nr:TfoX/Sxy family protein [Micrococcales bacterium]
MTDLTKLPEIGAVTARQLKAVGIEDAETLREVGARQAFGRIRSQLDPGACLALLRGLEAATRGIRAVELPPQDKAELLAWYKHLD